MVNVFQIAVEQLIELGFYGFLLPFILFTTVLYAVLRKSKILGESPVIHGIVSVSVGLFIFGMPVILGTNITAGLTAFFTQISIIIVAIVFGFLLASFFYPNIIERLPDLVKTAGFMHFIVWSALGFAIIFGLLNTITTNVDTALRIAKIPSELASLTFVILIVLFIFVIVSITGGKEV